MDREQDLQEALTALEEAQAEISRLSEEVDAAQMAEQIRQEENAATCCSFEFNFEEDCPEGFSYVEDEESCAYKCVPDCLYAEAQFVMPDYGRNTAGSTVWSYFHSSFAESGLSPFQVFLKNDKDGCSVAFGDEFTTDPSAFGTCDIITGNSITLTMENGVKHTFFYVSAYDVPDDL